MTVEDLYRICGRIIAEGKYSDARVLFDTEAQHFHVHMVPVDNASIEDIGDGDPFLTLATHEPHHTCSAECARNERDKLLWAAYEYLLRLKDGAIAAETDQERAQLVSRIKDLLQ